MAASMKLISASNEMNGVASDCFARTRITRILLRDRVSGRGRGSSAHRAERRQTSNDDE